MRRELRAISALCTVAGLLAGTAAADEVILGRRVAEAQRVPVERIDHEGWNRLLAKYVDDQGMVNYRAWHKSPSDVAALDAYLQQLSTAMIGAHAPRPAVLAFWINAYNAVTVRGILREYPTTSIRNHTAKFFGYNIWQDLLLPVGDANYSLEQIEHQQLRKMGEPRIHFAIVCASIGCPPLRNEAYTAERLEDQLASNARAFFAHPRNLQADLGRRSLALSSILSWFAEDFGSTEADLLRRIAPYIPDRQIRALAESGDARVTYLEYDWNLNEQRTGR